MDNHPLLITGIAIHANSNMPMKNEIEETAVMGSTEAFPASTKYSDTTNTDMLTECIQKCTGASLLAAALGNR